jgi:hypothetical protein
MLVAVVLGILFVTAVALVSLALQRRDWLRKELLLEINNQGNVESRYELRAEDPNGALEFRFSAGGKRLLGSEASQVVTTAEADRPSSPPASGAAAGARQTADRAIGLSGTIANALSSLSMLLPGASGSQVGRMATRARSTQMKAGRVQRLPDQAAATARSVTPSSKASVSQQRSGAVGGVASAQQSSSARREVYPWVETPYVAPGETLGVALAIRFTVFGQSQQCPFRIVSRSAEMQEAVPVVEESSVQMAGGFWALRYLPYLVILAVAAALLLLTFWLAHTGVLA